jgi:hypothetical protein
VEWNIERGLELDGIKLLFANTEEFLRRARRNGKKADITQMRADRWNKLHRALEIGGCGF